MNNRVTFSISIPVYNAARYLDRSIESVMNQTERDFELILVDDGSKDESATVCKKWCEKYPDIIRYIYKDNNGSLLTRRRCMQESNGDYIYIMDADDYLTDQCMLAKIKDVILKYHCDLVFFNCTIDSNTRKPFFKYPFRHTQIFENESLLELYKLVLNNTSLNPLWNKVFSRTLVDWQDDYSKYDVTNGTDMFQSIPIISNTRSAVYMDDVFYYYTTEDNNQSIVHKFKPSIFYSMKENWKRLQQNSEKWIYKPEHCNDLLNRRYMEVISSAAYRIRFADSEQRQIVREYLRTISNDDTFRDLYVLKGISLQRNVVNFLLYHKLYSILMLIIRIIK